MLIKARESQFGVAWSLDNLFCSIASSKSENTAVEDSGKQRKRLLFNLEQGHSEMVTSDKEKEKIFGGKNLEASTWIA